MTVKHDELKTSTAGESEIDVGRNIEKEQSNATVLTALSGFVISSFNYMT